MTNEPGAYFEEHMKGWHIGTMPPDNAEGLRQHYKGKGLWSAAMANGYDLGEQARRDAADIARKMAGRREP